MLKHLVAISALGASGCAVVHKLVPGKGAASQPTAAGAPSAAASQPTAPGAPSANRALPQLPDDGITSDLHRGYVGQIVFASHQIAKDGARADQLAAEFYADEPLYGRAYLPHSIENVAVYERGSNTPLRTQTRGYRFELFVDGKRVAQELESGVVSSERHASTTLQVWPHPDPSDDATPRGWVELVNKLPAGAHRIRIELWARDRHLVSRAPLAAGELTLHKDSGSTLAVGRTFATLDHGMVDPALQNELVGIARGFARKHGWKESFTDVAIRSREWVQLRHKTLRHVIGRRLDAWARAEWPDGHCTAQALLFEQHVDRGKPSGPLYVGSSGEQRIVDCTMPSNIAAVDHWRGKARAKPTPTAAEAPTPTLVSAPTVATAQSASRPKGAASQSASRPKDAASQSTSRPKVAASQPDANRTTVASAESPAAASLAQVSTATAHERPRTERFHLGIGVAANARESAAVASFAHAGVHLGRLDVGAGATWPLNVLGYARFAVVDGRFELAPMISATVLGEHDMSTEIALAGGLSFGYRVAGRIGLRLDVLVAYSLQNAGLAVPVLGSTFVRF